MKYILTGMKKENRTNYRRTQLYIASKYIFYQFKIITVTSKINIYTTESIKCFPSLFTHDEEDTEHDSHYSLEYFYAFIVSENLVATIVSCTTVSFYLKKKVGLSFADRDR